MRATLNHDPNYVFARFGKNTNNTLRLKEDEIGLWTEIDALQTQTIRDLVLEPVRRGDIDQMSFRFEMIREEWDREAKKRTLLEVRLVDVSVVTFPWYEGTDASVRSQMSKIREDALGALVDRERRERAARMNRNRQNFYERAIVRGSGKE